MENNVYIEKEITFNIYIENALVLQGLSIGELGAVIREVEEDLENSQIRANKNAFRILKNEVDKFYEGLENELKCVNFENTETSFLVCPVVNGEEINLES